MQCVDISIVDDNIAELTEVFSVNLSTNETQVIIDDSSSVTVSIIDNDGEIWTYMMYANLMKVTAICYYKETTAYFPFH